MPKYQKSSERAEQVKRACLVMTAQRLHMQKDYTNQETVSGSALKIKIKLTFISGNHILFNLIISLES